MVLNIAVSTLYYIITGLTTDIWQTTYNKSHSPPPQKAEGAMRTHMQTFGKSHALTLEAAIQIARADSDSVRQTVIDEVGKIRDSVRQTVVDEVGKIRRQLSWW